MNPKFTFYDIDNNLIVVPPPFAQLKNARSNVTVTR
jgi:hypothetical protein